MTVSRRGFLRGLGLASLALGMGIRFGMDALPETSTYVLAVDPGYDDPSGLVGCLIEVQGAAPTQTYRVLEYVGGGTYTMDRPFPAMPRAEEIYTMAAGWKGR